MHARTIAAGYFALQGLGGAAWWGWIAFDDGARARFSLPEDGGAALLTFALPDLALFVGGSLVVALAAARRARWAAPAAWFVAGGVAYATLWCAGAALLHGASALGAALMAPASAASVGGAIALSRSGARG